MSKKLVTLKSVERIVRLDDDGAVVLHRNKSKKRKQSWFLKPIEKGSRRLARAQRDAAAEYLDRHESSNRKRKNGWVRDYSKNTQRALRKGFKRIRLPGF